MTAPGSRPPGTKIRGSRRPAKMKMSKNTEPSKRVLRSEGQVQVSNADVRKLEPEAEPQKPSKWISFGPAYGDADTGFSKMEKQSALQHITSKGGSRMEYLLSSMSSREDEARKSYDRKVVDRLDGDPGRFLEMMVVDGCFFLQLALHILGAGELLGYHPNNPYFGAQSDSSSSRWIPAMFFVGNQIPYVVINALMEQAFFKEVIAQGMKRDTWKRLRKEAAEDVAKLALYQVVVEPQLRRDYRCRFHFHCHCCWSKKRDCEPPSDILSALHDLLLGSRDSIPISPEMRASQDLETGSMRMSDDSFPSAGKLYTFGIKLKKGKPGITNIKFKNFGYFTYLYLPPFIVHSHTESLMTSLVHYENKFHESEREVTAYLCLMRDLIPSYKDFIILQTQGIIQVKDQLLMGPMIRRLHNQDFLDNSKFTLTFSDMRRKIRENEVMPWRLMSFVCSIACGIITFIIAALTVVQTVFSVLSYNHPRN